MSAIDELKDGMFIDATGGDSSNNNKSDDHMAAEISFGEEDNKSAAVELSNLAPKKKSHTVIVQNNKQTGTSNMPQMPQRPQQKERTKVSIKDIAPNMEEEEKAEHESDIKESLEKDILNFDDPNSIFSQYIKNELKEMQDWTKEKEEEAALLKEEAETADESETPAKFKTVKSEEEDQEDSLVDNTMDTAKMDYSRLAAVPMEDISGLFDEEVKKETPTMANKETLVDDIPDMEDVVPQDAYDNVPEEDTVEETAEDTNIVYEDVPEVEEDEVPAEPTDQKVTPVVEEERFDAPDLEVEFDKDTNFATNIEEDDESATVTDNTDTDDVLKQLQKLATEKLKPVSKRLDISSFTVLKKPISNVAPLFEDQKARVCKWVLPEQGSIVLMKEFSGSELEKLREYSEDARSLDSLNRRFHLIYDHIASPKPASFEQWIRSTPYSDVDNYFFAIYIASFKGANYLPSDCPNKDCGETFLTDDVNVMDMVKFRNKEAKEKFAELYQSTSHIAGRGVYCTEVVPISDKIAIAFREPSIYNVFEIAGLDEKTRTNYSSVLDYIPYIDTIYSIDMANQTLTPITYKMYPDNATRTVRSKIQKYENIFNTLNVDEFGPIKAYVRAIADRTSDMYYVYPEVSCPKCGATTQEIQTTAEELVFTRYQLGSLVTTSLN